MRTLLFIFLLAGTVTTAILWNRQLCFQVEPAPAEQEEESLPTAEVEVVLGLPPGERPRRRPPAAPPGRAARPPGTPPTREPAPESRNGPGREATPPPAAAPGPVPPVERWAVLEEGETVYGLARRLLGKGSRYREILELNGLTGEEARNLPAGCRLKLPPR